MRLSVFSLTLLMSFTVCANEFDSDFDYMVTSYENGKYEVAFPGFVKLKGQGDARSWYYLGQMYEFGRGTEKNNNKAFTFYEKAAKGGFANAQISLAWMYAWGKGVHPNPEMALYWLNEARNQGNEEAREDFNLLYKRYQNRQLRIGQMKTLNALVMEMKKARNIKDL